MVAVTTYNMSRTIAYNIDEGLLELVPDSYTYDDENELYLDIPSDKFSFMRVLIGQNNARFNLTTKNQFEQELDDYICDLRNDQINIEELEYELTDGSNKSYKIKETRYRIYPNRIYRLPCLISYSEVIYE